jgi:hypothetical protein
MAWSFFRKGKGASGEPPKPARDEGATSDGVAIDFRIGGGPPKPSWKSEAVERPDAATLARLARAGVVVDWNGSDALGWIELEGDGERIRFGLGALTHGAAAKVGTKLRVLEVGVGVRGVPKATRVVPHDFVELRPAEVLRGLGLPAALLRASWPETHAALVEAYRPGLPACDRDRAMADSDDANAMRQVLAGWLGEPVDARAPICDAANRWLIRDEHGGGTPGTGLYLFELAGETGALYVLRTWSERERIPRVEQLAIGTCFDPDTSAALSGIFRSGGLRSAFAAHAPSCAICQRGLREAKRKSPDGVPPEFVGLIR